MTTEDLESVLTSLLSRIESYQDSYEQQAERFRVALSNGLRLLTNKGGSLLAGLHGDPDALTGLLIRSSEDLHSSIQDLLTELHDALAALLDAIRKQ